MKYILFIFIVFLLGMYCYTFDLNNLETMKNKQETTSDSNTKKISKDCPNMLIEKDGKFVLFNSNKEKVPGINPIYFNNLDEYIKYIDFFNKKKSKCPILYLQYTTNTQNEELIQVKSSLFENNGGLQPTKIDKKKYFEDNKILDATKDSTPSKTKKFNTNMYSGFDKHNQNIGLDTPLDQIFIDKSEKSPNPMDTHWGGKKYTEKKIKQGDYKDREVYKYKNPKI